MKRDYLADQQNRKKTSKNAMRILLVFILLFIGIIIRVALRELN